MDESLALYIGRQAMETAFMVSGPVLITCIASGIIVALFQAVTQIRDMSLTVVPKLFAVGIVLLIFGSWMLQILLDFTNTMFTYMQNIGH